MAYQVNGSTVAHDDEGYILDLSDWSRDLAAEIAKAEGLDMTDEHWAIVDFLRSYYDTYKIAPAVRVLIRAVKKEMGPEMGNKQHMEALFPGGPAKQGCKIAGLPKPTGCI